MMKKEKWKDEVLNSLEGINRAEPDPELYAGIQAKLGQMQESKRVQLVPRPYFSIIAASFALLIFANVYALTRQKSNVQTTDTSSVYQLDNGNFNLY